MQVLKNINYRETLEKLREFPELSEAFYFLMNKNPTGTLPYHGNIHNLTVGLLLFEIFSGHDKDTQIAATLAGLCHDCNHTGCPDSQEPNIRRAIETTCHLWPSHLRETIEMMILATEYPYPETIGKEDLNNINIQLKLAIRLADHSWASIFPFDIGALGIHKEQYATIDFRELEAGRKEFMEKAKELFSFLDSYCPDLLKPVYTLFKSE